MWPFTRRQKCSPEPVKRGLSSLELLDLRRKVAGRARAVQRETSAFYPTPPTTFRGVLRPKPTIWMGCAFEEATVSRSGRVWVLTFSNCPWKAILDIPSQRVLQLEHCAPPGGLDLNKVLPVGTRFNIFYCPVLIPDGYPTERRYAVQSRILLDANELGRIIKQWRPHLEIRLADTKSKLYWDTSPSKEGL